MGGGPGGRCGGARRAGWRTVCGRCNGEVVQDLLLPCDGTLKSRLRLNSAMFFHIVH